MKPDDFAAFPHQKFQCPECMETVTVIGWEIEAVRCPHCVEYMEWVADLYHPNYE